MREIYLATITNHPSSLQALVGAFPLLVTTIWLCPMIHVDLLLMAIKLVEA